MDLIMYTLRSVASVLVEPSLIIMLIIIGIFFYIKNKKIVTMQKMLIGEEVNSALELTLSQIVLGIVAGVAASLILSHLGVIFNDNSGIQFIFLVSMILMIIKPRFVCFSYSAAVLGLISIICAVLNIRNSDGNLILNINITMIMTFVGVVHIIESILVMLDGSRGSIPIFSNRNGKIIGGYALTRYWIIPIAIFLAYEMVSGDNTTGQSIATPGWWPILRYKSILNIISTMVLTLFPFIGIIGYSSVTFTKKKRQKIMSSGIFILIYGIILTLVAQLGQFGMIGQIFVIIFAPLGHEIMLNIQRRLEEKREPLFVSSEDGMTILEVVPYSKAYDLGLKPGDKIVSANGKMIESEIEIYEIMKENLNKIVLKVCKFSGEIVDHKIEGVPNKRFGVVLVPKSVDMKKIVSFENKTFSDVLNDVQKRK